MVKHTGMFLNVFDQEYPESSVARKVSFLCLTKDEFQA